MSELKWNWVYYPYLDTPNKQEESALKAGYIKVVIKDEADEYIKELKEQNHELCQALHSMYSEEEMNYQKFKRCLAMVKWCERKRIDAANYRIPRQKWDFYDKWHKRWLELAEKFKEAK